MSGTKTKSNVKIDEDMLSQALEKAKQNNIALSSTQLVNFMLHRVVDDGFPILTAENGFVWVEKKITTMYWSSQQLSKLISRLAFRGFRHDYSFMFNYLVWLYLNKF